MAELSTAVDNVRLDDDSHQAGSIEEGFTQYAEDQPDDKLPFYEIEGQILSLWDRLNELKLEIAVLEKPTVELPVRTWDDDMNYAKLIRPVGFIG